MNVRVLTVICLALSRAGMPARRVFRFMAWGSYWSGVVIRAARLPWDVLRGLHGALRHGEAKFLTPQSTPGERFHYYLAFAMGASITIWEALPAFIHEERTRRLGLLTEGQER
jgi:hypothetical protein